MSETIEAAPIDPQDTVAPEQSVEQAAAEAFEQGAEPQVEDTSAGEPDAQPKKADQPGWVKPAIDRLTREKHEARRALEAAQKEAAILRQMVEGKLPPAAAPDQSDDAVIERKARELLAKQEAAAKQNELITNGVKEIGEQAWNEKTGILAHLGATDNETFLRAVMTVPDGHKVVAALADDPTRVMGLLQRSPLEMATEIGRMAAEIGRKPAAKKITAAPTPGSPVASGRAVGEPSLYDPNLSMREWAALYDKQAAKKRGLR